MKSYSSYLHETKLLILLFHGVIPKTQHPIRNYTTKHITRDSFIKILQELENAGGRGLSMKEVLKYHLENQAWPTKSYAITFDDGFANNYDIAAPILDEMKIPATFYITTQFIEEGSCSWIDQIEYAIENAKHCDLDLPDIDIQGHYQSPQEKINLLTQIRQRVKGIPELNPYTISTKIWQQLNIQDMRHDKDLDKKMTWPQVQQLAQHPNFIVGGHGHTHRILSYLSESELEKELNECFSLLKKNLTKSIVHYSYPEGLKSCYSPSVIQALKKRGIQCCPSAEDGLNSRADSLFDLKRIMVT